MSPINIFGFKINRSLALRQAQRQRFINLFSWFGKLTMT